MVFALNRIITDDVPLAAAALAVAPLVPEFDDIARMVDVDDDGCDGVGVDLNNLQQSQNFIVIALCHSWRESARISNRLIHFD